MDVILGRIKTSLTYSWIEKGELWTTIHGISALSMQDNWLSNEPPPPPPPPPPRQHATLVDAGCVSQHTRNIYLLSLSYSHDISRQTSIAQEVNRNITTIVTEIAKNGSVTIRTGFRGMCLTLDEASWDCSESAKILANMFGTSGETNLDPLNIIRIADTVRKRIAFDGLLYISLTFALITITILSFIPSWKTEKDSDTGSEREVKPFPSRKISNTVCAASGSAAIFAFVSVLWQHLAAVSALKIIENMSYGGLMGKVGTNSMVVGWLGVLMLWLAFMGCLLMVLSLRKVRRTFGR
ncbi:hypothetical protein OCU04_006504 [Sclerotinia nivalis]|uniref:Uncharacterized protein n=1 Tax=Sclerotinia nivalis TaxID=352851 RepID=A0A9X0AK32_9HELO|nr:hypothetical protein OCU04_006504 [Sclerotinia nivalis]